MSPLELTNEGQAYWRSLAHRAESEQVLSQLHEEFPGYDPQELRTLSRRGFLRLMAASLALAGLTVSGCRRWPETEILPFAHQGEGTLPGVSQWYATMMELSGVATGVLVKSFDGRPIKIEGNKLHPLSLGAADALLQASVLSLYDPDRSRTPIQRVNDQPVTRSWADFDRFAQPHFAALRQARGRGLAIIAPASCSPTLLRLKEQLLTAMPEAQWCTHEPIDRAHEYEGSRLAFGEALRAQYHLDRAAVVACFDADLLGAHPAHQRHAHDWAQRRRQVDRGLMNRLYAVEANFSLTGSVADHRLAVRPARVGTVLAALAARLGMADGAQRIADGQEARFVERLARDLLAHRGEALIAVGPAQPPHAHALAHAINEHLGHVGTTLTYTREPLAEQDRDLSWRDLTQRIDAGEVTTLIVLGGNPVYDAPTDGPLHPDQPNLTTIHLGLYADETAARCHWHVPMAHDLECWGDGCAWDGSYSVQQPLILPLFDGRSRIELLAQLLGEETRDGQALVRSTHARQWDESSWRVTLHDGIQSGSAWPTVTPRVSTDITLPEARDHEGFDLLFVPDAKVYDGRFANNGWLQELPDPLTKLTWDNAALISVRDAEQLNITTGQVITLARNDAGGTARTLKIAAYVMPGVAQGTVVLPLGYGRTMAGHVGSNVGINACALRSSEAVHTAHGATLTPTRQRHVLAMTQDHHLIDAIGVWGRDKRVGKQGESGYLIREASLETYRQDRNVFRRKSHGNIALELFDPPSEFNTPHAWGMAVDLNQCIGCSACVVACQAENNIPVVGKAQVAVKREMHWLRIDRYFKGPADQPDVVHMPLACGHCETAPCEQVCPVAATVHDSEGLNVMVYNRCIGTRYCANNCPYKVRRFNYFDFHAADPRGKPQPWLGIPDQQPRNAIDELKQMVFNPDVTVRMRGVMEKCTYCTQRINEARIAAKMQFAAGEREDETVRDGEITPACAGACPTQAIVFGDLNDPDSRVSQLVRGNRAYSMLEELNLRPRTRYLAKVRNPAQEGGEA